MAEQWAARHMWGTPPDVHSTQRSRRSLGDQAVVACERNAEELVTFLVQYNIESRTKKEAKAVSLALKQATDAYTTMPVVEAMRGQINALAFEKLLGQASQALSYKCTKLPPLPGGAGASEGAGEERYLMQRIKSAPKPRLELKADGEMKKWEFAEDEGLELCDTDRITTFTWCSCQYTK